MMELGDGVAFPVLSDFAKAVGRKAAGQKLRSLLRSDGLSLCKKRVQKRWVI
jgi:hypothetical protein